MKKHWFKWTLLALAAILTVVVWGVLDTLWHSLEEYEANSEVGAVSEYFSRFSNGDYETAAETSGISFDGKITKEDYIRYLKETFGTDLSNLRYAGRESDVAGEKIYRIYSGNTALGEVNLAPIEGDRKWNVTACLKYQDPVTVTAPAGVTVSANGVVQTSEVSASDPHFKGVESVFDVPQQVTYTLDGYLYAPQISGVASDGTVCSLVTDDEGNSALTVPPSEEQKAEYETLMQDFSKLYACYIAKDTTFARLRAKMDASTPFYESVRTFSNYWYNTHSGYEFRNWELFDIECTGEGFFSGSVKFDHVVFWRGEEKIYPSSFRLSFRQVKGTWLLVDLKYL